MIRRAFIRALSGAILTTLLGVKAWRLEDSEERRWEWYTVDAAPPGNSLGLRPGDRVRLSVPWAMREPIAPESRP